MNDTVQLAYVDNTVLSVHASPRGAAVALVEDARTRMKRHDKTLDDAEHAILVDVLVRESVLNLNQGRSMTSCAIPTERMTIIAMHVNRQMAIEPSMVLD